MRAKGENGTPIHPYRTSSQAIPDFTLRRTVARIRGLPLPIASRRRRESCNPSQRDTILGGAPSCAISQTCPLKRYLTFRIRILSLRALGNRHGYRKVMKRRPKTSAPLSHKLYCRYKNVRHKAFLLNSSPKTE